LHETRREIPKRNYTRIKHTLSGTCEENEIGKEENEKQTAGEHPQPKTTEPPRNGNRHSQQPTVGVG